SAPGDEALGAAQSEANPTRVVCTAPPCDDTRGHPTRLALAASSSIHFQHARCKGPCADWRTIGSRLALFLDMPSFLEEVLLERGDVIPRRLGILLAGDGKVILLLPLHQQLEELKDVPGVLLPFEARRPCAVPWTVGHVFRIVVDRLHRALAAGGSEGVLRGGGEPPLDEVHRLLVLQVAVPAQEDERLAADI